jgi:hypothetical protein
MQIQQRGDAHAQHKPTIVGCLPQVTDHLPTNLASPSEQSVKQLVSRYMVDAGGKYLKQIDWPTSSVRLPSCKPRNAQASNHLTC